jgi:hypothetical protein
MSRAKACPCCGKVSLVPPFPSVQTVPWSSDCSCSDHSICVYHRFGTDIPPVRPPEEELQRRAEEAHAKALEEHKRLLERFARHEAMESNYVDGCQDPPATS